MSEDLLHHYNRERNSLIDLAGAFGRAHPAIAEGLRLGDETVEDPHVRRLIDSVAFLNARVHRKLEDGFPELTEALLGVLYPHFLAPIPSMAIVQFEGDPEMTAGYPIAARTQLETDRKHGEVCTFQTAYPVEVWPIRVRNARVQASPFESPTTPRSTGAAAVLKVRLETMTAGVSFADLGPERARFFLRGQPQLVHPLHELLFNDVVEVAIATGPDDARPVVLGPEALRPVGFSEEEGLLPYSKRSFLGYRLLSEYFAFPQKFLFVEVDLPPEVVARAGSAVELYCFLRRSSSDLEAGVSAKTFALGCTPIVNLFKKRASPVPVDHRRYEYRIVPDPRRPLAMEVYSVDAVTRSSPDSKKPTEIHPIYGLDHAGDAEGVRSWWYPVRRGSVDRSGESAAGTDVFLRTVDLDLSPSEVPEDVLGLSVTCMNRDLPAALPFSADQPRLQLVEGAGPITAVRALTKPTRTLRPERGGSTAWKLVSHLSLNHLSLGDDHASLEALKEILRLYDVGASDEARKVIEKGLVSVRSKPHAVRTSFGGRPGFCRGTEVTLELDAGQFTGSGRFLFASVLERFLGLYCSLNSFVQTVVRTTDQEGDLRRWPPRAGDRALL